MRSQPPTCPLQPGDIWRYLETRRLDRAGAGAGAVWWVEAGGAAQEAGMQRAAAPDGNDTGQDSARASSGRCWARVHRSHGWGRHADCAGPQNGVPQTRMNDNSPQTATVL